MTGHGPVLDVENLTVLFEGRGGRIHAVTDFGCRLAPGETLGIVGESGCGKTTAMLALMRLLPMPPARIVSGRALLDGKDLMSLDHRAMQSVRGRQIGFIFQDALSALNPVLTIGRQIMEPMRHHLGLGRAAARRRAIELLDRVGIPEPARRLSDYPHQFSGGMRQRAMIAAALACGPRLLIADEPTTALDVTIQAQILELVASLRREFGMAILWISHDLNVIAQIADRVVVMYAGQVVERAAAEDLCAQPRHPYTEALLRTRPRLSGPKAEWLPAIAGQPPAMRSAPAACAFAPRCLHAHERCHSVSPPLVPVRDGHETACWLRVPGRPERAGADA